MTLTVATANMLKTLGEKPARQAAEMVLGHRPHFGGLQEWLAERDPILRDLGTLIRFPAVRAKQQPTRGYVFVRPFRDAPVGFYNARVFGLERLRTLTLAPGPRPTRATEMLLQHRSARTTVPVLLIHLLAHHDQPAYKKAWECGRAAAMDWAESWHGTDTFVLGDTNKHLMDLPPLKSCWDGNFPLPTGPGGGTIDTIYARRRAAQPITVHTASDHHAVVATYAG